MGEPTNWDLPKRNARIEVGLDTEDAIPETVMETLSLAAEDGGGREE